MNSINNWCIICLPRTGSQLLTKILTNDNIRNIRNLGEIFEPHTRWEYYLDSDHVINAKYNKPSKFSIEDIYSDYDKKLSMIESTSNLKTYIVKFFLIGNRSADIQKEIITRLANKNFKFITLERNFEDQIISFIIAKYYGAILNQSIWAINSTIDNSAVYIDISKLDGINYDIDIFFESKLLWKDRLQYVMNGIPYYSVNYESMKSDVEYILNREVTISGHKTLEHDKYSYIENADEIRQLVKMYSDKLDVLLK